MLAFDVVTAYGSDELPAFDNLCQTFQPIDGIVEGPQWYQGDHSMFIQKGCPAVAVSSQWFADHIDEQQITHTDKDNIGVVDCQRLVEIARAIAMIVESDVPFSAS